MGPSAEAEAACGAIASNPGRALEATRAGYAERLAGLFDRLPRLKSSSPALEQFYNRSLVPLLMNRWDVPEFALRPYYATGSVNGGCVGNYLWDFGGDWELFRATALARLGDTDAAIPALARLLEGPSNLTVDVLRLDPDFDRLRDDRRFTRLLAKE